MNFTMTAPCSHCPFRSDIPGYLRRGRAAEIVRAMIEDGQTFSCHETTVSDEDEDGSPARREVDTTQHCAGAMILLEKLGVPNRGMFLAVRFEMYDPTRLRMASPVFDTAEEFIEHHNG